MGMTMIIIMWPYRHPGLIAYMIIAMMIMWPDLIACMIMAMMIIMWPL
jgi:hypothetical protein